ncbi:MAG TPA: enoyl-CoA hydratase/isomerase family protein [Kofleriaceae bacterium]|nr:enoyl-CoA hydratase/isomerase family protein [Kofleriaceae bacterium]
MSATIAVEQLEDDGVLSLVLNQPKANVLSMAMMVELRAALAAHRDDPKLRLVIVRGAGKHFSFGASVPEHRRDSAQAMLEVFHALVRDVATYPVPIAALVLGQCLGGAFELVLACHFVFAARSAVFACPEIKLGVVPPVLAVLGHHRLGGPLAERMVLTGGELAAVEAHARGLVTAVVPDECDGSDTAALPFVLDWYRKTLAPLSAFSLREATHAVRHGSGLVASLGAPLDAAERRYVERLLPSRDGNEGIEAFLEKRPPAWVNA